MLSISMTLMLMLIIIINIQLIYCYESNLLKRSLIENNQNNDKSKYSDEILITEYKKQLTFYNEKIDDDDIIFEKLKLSITSTPKYSGYKKDEEKTETNNKKEEDKDNEGNRRRLFSAVLTSTVYGTSSGSSTQFSTSTNDIISKICIRSGSLVDAIQVTFKGSNTPTNWVGGSGGGETCETPASNECFSDAFIRSAGSVDALMFATGIQSYDSSGNNNGGYLTHYWGGSGGYINIYNSGKYCLCGLNIYYGAYINSIQFFYC